MTYAIRNDGQGWRSVNSESDCTSEETFSANQPGTIVPSKTSRIKALQDRYEIDRNKLNMAWLSAIIADGEPEVERKAEISIEMNALRTKLQSDIASIIAEA